jgi:tRNA threonylcarbamoyladenosine biosynthesis protein TsaE
MKYESKSLSETEGIAHKVLEELQPKQSGATIVGLSGDLGSGKTAFTQALAKILGVEETVTSPTFIIEKIYPTSHLPMVELRGTSKFTTLIHIDAYRLESGEELTKLGWHDIAENPKNLIVIEWPEKVADILPSDMKIINFTFIDETTRKIEW